MHHTIRKYLFVPLIFLIWISYRTLTSPVLSILSVKLLYPCQIFRLAKVLCKHVSIPKYPHSACRFSWPLSSWKGSFRFFAHVSAASKVRSGPYLLSLVVPIRSTIHLSLRVIFESITPLLSWCINPHILHIFPHWIYLCFLATVKVHLLSCCEVSHMVLYQWFTLILVPLMTSYTVVMAL